MCPSKGEYYLTGIASLCKFKNLIGRRWQCLQKSSHFVSVAWHRSWIEEKVGMKVSIKLHPHQEGHSEPECKTDQGDKMMIMLN